MAQASRPCKGCGTTIYRTVAVAPIKYYCGPDCRPRCSVEGCEKPRHGNVYCTEHHTRWKRTGDPLTPLQRHPNAGLCSVDDCDQPMRKMTWCASHYAQWVRFDEIRPWMYKWGDGGYNSTHRWLRRQLGSPANFECVGSCGRSAQEWSYDHADPDARHDPVHGSAYSRKPEHYEPRCKKCHRTFDRQYRKQNMP